MHRRLRDTVAPLANLVWFGTGVWLAAAVSARGQGPAAPVVIAPVVDQAEVATEQVFVGTVHPARRSAVGSAVAGRVKEFPQNAGDRVKKGAVLAQLLTRQIDIQVAAAEAEVSLRREELAELKNGALPEEKQQASARLAAAKSLMDYTAQKFGRTESLAERNAASADQLADAASVAERSRQVFLEATAAHALVMAGPRKEKIAQAAARLQAAQEEVSRLEDQLQKHTIVAPFDGYVVAEHTEEGQWIDQGELVAEVVEVAAVDVEVMVLESFVPYLRVAHDDQPGTHATLEVNAVAGRSFEGQVTHVVPQADVRSRSFPVRIRLANEILEDGSPLLRPGMFATVRLAVGRRGSALMVPKDALVLGGPQPLVYVAALDPKDESSGTVHPVPVTIGRATGELIEVTGELKGGEWVVTEGNERLRPPWKVRVLSRPKDKAADSGPTAQAATAQAEAEQAAAK